jgi:hypothetical protein
MSKKPKILSQIRSISKASFGKFFEDELSNTDILDFGRMC